MRNAGLDEAQDGFKIARRNINDLRWHHPYGRKWRELNSLLMKVKEGKKAGLKLNIHKTKIVASSPISWGNNGNRDRLYFGGL